MKHSWTLPKLFKSILLTNFCDKYMWVLDAVVKLFSLNKSCMYSITQLIHLYNISSIMLSLQRHPTTTLFLSVMLTHIPSPAPSRGSKQSKEPLLHSRTSFPLTINLGFSHLENECRLKSDQGRILEELGDKAELRWANALESTAFVMSSLCLQDTS